MGELHGEGLRPLCLLRDPVVLLPCTCCVQEEGRKREEREKKKKKEKGKKEKEKKKMRKIPHMEISGEKNKRQFTELV
jgi:hypothetical protein